MNKDIKFEKKVIKPVVKAAKKYKKKYHSAPDKSNIGHLKIQTANIFARIAFGIIGLLLLVGGVFLFIEESFIFSFVNRFPASQFVDYAAGVIDINLLEIILCVFNY